MPAAMALLLVLETALALSHGAGLPGARVHTARARTAVALQPPAHAQVAVRQAEKGLEAHLQAARGLAAVALTAGTLLGSPVLAESLPLTHAEAAVLAPQQALTTATEPTLPVSLGVAERLPAPGLLIAESSPSDVLTQALNSLQGILKSGSRATSDELSSTANALSDEAAEAKRESEAADARRKARLREAAGKRAAAARARQEEVAKMAQSVQEDTRPYRATVFQSEVRKQKRMEEQAAAKEYAEVERVEAINAAIQLAAAKELEAEAKILKRASQIEDARREVRIQEAEAVRQAALKVRILPAVVCPPSRRLAFFLLASAPSRHLAVLCCDEPSSPPSCIPKPHRRRWSSPS
jgi:hypothetical protein